MDVAVSSLAALSSVGDSGAATVARRLQLCPDMSKRVVPNSECFRIELQSILEVARRSDDSATDCATYSILWFMATGRSFTGLERAGAHMDGRTIGAFVKRVVKLMGAAAKRARGAEAGLVTGDLSNDILAQALGYANAREACDGACSHPYGQRFTLSRSTLGTGTLLAIGS